MSKSVDRDYSQCPGECYDSFWEDPEGETVDFEDLFSKWKESSSVKYFVRYKRRAEDKEWANRRCGSMGEALCLANLYLSKGRIVDSVYTVTPDDPLKTQIESFYKG